MPTYYSHMEDGENGKQAAIQDWIEQRLGEIDETIEQLEGEKKVLNSILPLIAKQVCQTCRGRRTMTYYPLGTSPGQGARQSVPCSECRQEEFQKARKELDSRYSR